MNLSNINPQFFLIVVRIFNILKSKKLFKDTHKENTPSNKTEALTKSMNIIFGQLMH